MLPALVGGTAPRIALDLAAGSYYGGDKPEDGRIDWSHDATRIHDLVRAVAPPYPGAFTIVAGRPVRVLRTRVIDQAGPAQAATLAADNHRLIARCGGGGVLAVQDLEIDGMPVTPCAFAARFGASPVPLPGASP